MSSLRTFTTLKKKEKSKKSVPYAHDPDLAYDRTRNNLIEGLKITKAVSEATSFLGPMKAVCELGILFLETTKVVDENTSSLRELHQRLSAHIDILDDDLGTLPFGTRGPAAIAEFQHAQQRYVAGLKIIRDRLNDMLLQRVSGGVRSILGKIADARIDPRIIASIKEEITQYSQIFAEATSRPMIDLQEEVWKLASLGPEQARPMGTQHKLCLPGTRMSILKEIRNWASGFDTEKPMFWLCDVGGTGKSTVAYTLCHEWDTNDHVIVARFFFSKNARSTSETDIVCTTLANDLGSKDNAIRKHVQSAFVKDKQLDARPLSYQFSKLVEASIRLTSKRVVLVIDAVDECRADMRRDLLNLIVEKLPTLPNVRIFLTSRPEPDIMALLQGKAIVRNMHYELQGSENPSNVDDIKLYVEKYFTGLLTRSERQQLIDKANGLFIWVATARLELDQADGPDARVRTLTSLISRGEGGDINHLYAGILRRLAQETSFNEVKRIIGTISILFEPVSIQALSKLTRMDLDDLEPMIKSMHSVLRTEHVVEFLHPTFHEYLHSGRNTELRIDADLCHLDVARGTLQTLQADLRQDVCNISAPYQRYPDNNTIIDLDTRLNALWAHSPALLYSAKYWSAHVIPVISHQDMLSALELFLHNSALHVIELLSLIGKLVWTKNFEDIRKSLQGNSSRQDEYSLCREVVWSMSTYQHLIKRSALTDDIQILDICFTKDSPRLLAVGYNQLNIYEFSVKLQAVRHGAGW
ncbi:SubName: Full=Related to NACHT/WD40 domain-containing protein-Laccaria bicolor {ECO:0000313/EMBL:CCA73460.1} [Serendipita indica DSM 11827]|nr:SubName: Full=Related to NACHT/WD40 domain-containing protein-Laccaria bicolor {ECO:0000313/EMBL:CCA73460.1} [Serendipita indica DSM 11827]